MLFLSHQQNSSFLHFDSLLISEQPPQLATAGFCSGPDPSFSEEIQRPVELPSITFRKAASDRIFERTTTRESKKSNRQSLRSAIVTVWLREKQKIY
jgi:hypothetical protein